MKCHLIYVYIDYIYFLNDWKHGFVKFVTSDQLCYFTTYGQYTT